MVHFKLQAEGRGGCRSRAPVRRTEFVGWAPVRGRLRSRIFDLDVDVLAVLDDSNTSPESRSSILYGMREHTFSQFVIYFTLISFVVHRSVEDSSAGAVQHLVPRCRYQHSSWKTGNANLTT